MGKNFTEIDEGFVCINCGQKVEPLGYSCRDHCPYCLHSLHVDINPGDRLEQCEGILAPIGAEHTSKGITIVYRCKSCRKIKKNIAAKDDDMKKIIQLSGNPI